MVSCAMQNRGALALICTLVALASLLCAGRESLAKQPVKAPEPGGQTASHQPAGAPNPGHRAPAAPQEQTSGGHSPRPVHQHPTPRTTPQRSHGNNVAGHQKSAGSPDHQNGKGAGSPRQHNGAGSPGERGKPASPPGRENYHPRGQGGTGRPEQAAPPPDHNTQTGQKADRQTNEPTPPKKNPTPKVTSANRPDVGPSNRAAGGHADRQPPTQEMAGHDTGSNARPPTDARPATQSSYHRSGRDKGGFSGSHSIGSRNEQPTRLEGASSAHQPGRPDARSARTVGPVRGRDAVLAAPPGGMHRPAQAQLAPVAPFASTKLVLDPPWDKRVSLVQRTEGLLHSLPGGSQDLSAGTPHKGSLKLRGPPLQGPSPLSGFGPVMVGGAATGSASSGGGTAPLFAVIALCLIAVLRRTRFLAFCSILRPAAFPRPALERPG
jgi:hypothetical protein